MGSLYKRTGSEYWYFRYKDLEGNVVRISSGTHNKAEAQIKLDQIENDLYWEMVGLEIDAQPTEPHKLADMQDEVEKLTSAVNVAKEEKKALRREVVELRAAVLEL